MDCTFTYTNVGILVYSVHFKDCLFKYDSYITMHVKISELDYLFSGLFSPQKGDIFVPSSTEPACPCESQYEEELKINRRDQEAQIEGHNFKLA